MLDSVKGERRGRSIVQSVRLAQDDYLEIERLAGEAGVPISALIRGWVLDGLTANGVPRYAMQSIILPARPSGFAASPRVPTLPEDCLANVAEAELAGSGRRVRRLRGALRG